jgi:hypothetical protein
VYEPYAKLSRGFFGKPQIDALISLVVTPSLSIFIFSNHLIADLK